MRRARRRGSSEEPRRLGEPFDVPFTLSLQLWSYRFTLDAADGDVQLFGVLLNHRKRDSFLVHLDARQVDSLPDSPLGPNRRLVPAGLIETRYRAYKALTP